MSEFMRRIPLNSKEPVHYVCYHPVAEKRLLRGESAEPSCLAVDYEYENPIVDVFRALGWQGGTIHQAVAEIKRLRDNTPGPAAELIRELRDALRFALSGMYHADCACPRCEEPRTVLARATAHLEQGAESPEELVEGRKPGRSRLIVSGGRVRQETAEERRARLAAEGPWEGEKQ